MEVDSFTDAELEALTALAGKDWLAGFDGSLLPGRIQAMRTAGNMRRITKMVATILQYDRATLTAAIRKMRDGEAKDIEATYIEAAETGLQYHEGQAALFREARERLRVADARLKLAALKP